MDGLLPSSKLKLELNATLNELQGSNLKIEPGEIFGEESINVDQNCSFNINLYPKIIQKANKEKFFNTNNDFVSLISKLKTPNSINKYNKKILKMKKISSFQENMISIFYQDMYIKTRKNKILKEMQNFKIIHSIVEKKILMQKNSLFLNKKLQDYNNLNDNTFKNEFEVCERNENFNEPFELI